MNESQTKEWKAAWRDEYLKWLCGFANAQGGVLEIGRNDHGEVVGIDNAAQLMEELPNKLRDQLGIMADIDLTREGDRNYLRITVEPYEVPISYRGEYHYRSGSTKQVLRGAALNRFLLHKTGKRWDAVPLPNVGIDDLDVSTLTRFRENATRSKRLDQNVLGMDDADLVEKLHLTENNFLKRATVLLFHPDPEKFFTASSIKIGYFESMVEVRFHDEICGNLFTQVSKTMELLMTKYLKAVISYEGIQRVETYPVPQDALKEALLNAVVHRDYAVPAQIQIRVYDDQLHIWNAGELPEDWSVEKLLGQHSSRPYNPDIANAFFQAGEIESWGRGIERMLESCRREKLPEPTIQVEPHEILIKFWFSDDYLNKSMVRPSTRRASRSDTAQETTQEIRKTTQEKILALLRESPELTRSALAIQIGITTNGVKYHLDNLRKANRIRRVGSTKKGHWKVIEIETDTE